MFENITVESIKNDILKEITDMDVREGSFANNLISPVSYKIWELMQSFNACIPIAFVDETSGKYIDMRAGEYGIKRKQGTKATAKVVFTGKNGTIVNAGSIFVTEDGYEYILDASVTIGEEGTAEGSVTAAKSGEIYNTEVNTITGMYKTISGLTSVTNTTKAEGGTDDESDESLVKRLYEYWQRPATSGNIYHYMMWAKEVDGVGEAKVFPLWNGNGTVKVVICSSEMRSCNEEIVSACKEHIEEMRPIGATVTVESAVEKEINIEANIETDGGRKNEEIQKDIEASIDEYLKSIAFTDKKVLYNQIGYIILSTQGVLDFTFLLVNGSNSNIEVAENEIAVKGTVVING